MNLLEHLKSPFKYCGEVHINCEHCNFAKKSDIYYICGFSATESSSYKREYLYFK